MYILRAIYLWIAPAPIGSYRLQYRVGYGDWQTLENIEANEELAIVHDDFELVLADAIRLETIDRIKLYEIEVR